MALQASAFICVYLIAGMRLRVVSSTARICLSARPCACMRASAKRSAVLKCPRERRFIQVASAASYLRTARPPLRSAPLARIE
eukprot:6201571-Pleurochrysis_carterae.AAC.3